MNEVKDIRVGDWIRFRYNGHLVIAEVRYLTQRAGSVFNPFLITDVGEVSATSVLEARRVKL